MWQKNWKVISLVVIALLASTAALMEYRRIAVLNDRLGCAAFWLGKAKSLHQTQMASAGNLTDDSMRIYMDSVDGAYVCATKDPIAGHAPDASASFGQYGVLPQR
jgi:hypothetical protein